MGNRNELFNCLAKNLNNYSNYSNLHYINVNNNFGRNYFKSFCINGNINNKNSMGNRNEQFNCSNKNKNNYSDYSNLHYINTHNNFDNIIFKI